MRWRIELTFQVAIRIGFLGPGQANNAAFTVFTRKRRYMHG
jgi:hypothetical protein